VTFSKAVFAKDNPMMMAIGPVTVGGKYLFQSQAMLKRLTINPAAMETKPDRMIPN
jgi:hypothetical protein